MLVLVSCFCQIDCLPEMIVAVNLYSQPFIFGLIKIYQNIIMVTFQIDLVNDGAYNLLLEIIYKENVYGRLIMSV